MKNVLSIVLLALLVGCSDSEQYCSSLVKKAQSVDTQEYLRGWVLENVAGIKFDAEYPGLRAAGGMWPGFFWLDVPIDKTVLGFNGPIKPQPRLVGMLDDIESVFFGERSSYGYLVLNSESDNFGVDPEHLSQIVRDIAVVCRERD